MVTRKSSDGPPDAKGGERPGSYVKISGSRRRRKGRKLGLGASTMASAAPPSAQGDERAEAEDASDADGDESLDHTVDDLRRSRSAGRPSYRPPGPLGMDRRATDESRATDDAESPDRADDMAAAPRLDRVALDGAGSFSADNTNQAGSPDDELSPEQRALIDEELYRQLSEPPANLGAGPVRPAVLIREDSSRQSLSSVLGARPSLRPSPTPPVRRVSLAAWLAIGLLVSIIGAAAAVAVRERMREDDVAHAPPTEPAKSAKPVEPVVEPRPPAASEAPLQVAPVEAPRDAAVDVQKKRSAPRVFRPRKPVVPPRPASQAPVSSAPSSAAPVPSVAPVDQPVPLTEAAPAAPIPATAPGQ